MTDPFGRVVNCPETDGEGVGYVYDSQSRTFYPTVSDTQGTESEGGVRWLTRYVVICGYNNVDRPDHDMCVEAGCETIDGFGYMTQVYRRTSVAEPWLPWPGRERECRVAPGETDLIHLEDVKEEIVAIIEEHYRKIAQPEITVAPSANALVNLPVIASTPDAGEVSFAIENPLPGRVEASPMYTWAWSNGSSASGAGRPYDGTNPLDSPAHYPVSSTFSTSGTGSVSLAATWAIVLTVEGIPPIDDIEPLVYETAQSFPVRTARTVLVD